MSYEDTTVLRRLRIEEDRAETYEELFDQIRDEQAAEWEAEFEGAFQFVPNVAEIHRLVVKRMQHMRAAAMND